MADRRLILGFYGSALLLSLLAGYALCRWVHPYRPFPQPWPMAGKWITSPSPESAVGYYRKTLSLESGVSNAWLAIAACDGFELIVNGRVLGGQSLWRPNRSYQFAMSERGQRVNNSQSIPGVSYARDFQWSGYANDRLPVFFDLSRALQTGNNVICIRVDSRAAPNRLCVDGEIRLESGQRMALDSDRSWKASELPRQDSEQDWTDVEYGDRAWTAASLAANRGVVYRTFAPEIFSLPFQGNWLTAGKAEPHRAIWFETTWHLDRRPDDAWLRVITNRTYDLYINGHKAESPTQAASDLSAGDWIVNTGAPSGREVGAFDACSVGSMLRVGANTIAIRLIAQNPAIQWRPKVAVDGRAMGGGWSSDLFSSAALWSARGEDSRSEAGLLPVVETGRPGVAEANVPRKRYLGYCYAGGDKFRDWTLLGAATVLLSLGAAFWGERRMKGAGRWRSLAEVSASMAIASTVLAGAIVLDCSFAVRDEILWMLPGVTWAGILALACASGAGTGAMLRWGRGCEFPGREWWKRRGYAVALGAVLATCGFTRLYRLEFQPTDADEWASVQTILAIAETGTPKLIDDVFYTRSPLYHYLTAGAVRLFGENFWALRVPTALFAVWTAALLYRCGSRLLKSRWIGLGASALFTIHPLAIAMGHQVRFYQQQQFFALLTVYYFCLGFVSEQRMKFRYLALAAFFAAVFSQEISVMIGCALLASYLLFAEAKGWRSECKWLIAAGCGLILVALDFVIFQTVCLTEVDGVSPRVEPALQLNLMYPSTFYWIFSLYSRLHFGLSAVFLVGFPFALRDRNRNVLALYLTFLSGIIFSTILISGSGVRFQYWLFPLFFLLAVHGARELAGFVFTLGIRELRGRHRVLGGAMATLLVLVIGLSFSPWKIPGSYSTKILPDVDGAFAYVREHLAPEDALAVAAPHTAAAICEVGRVEYDLELPLLHDFVYRKNGRLIDRNAGAEVISKLDELQDACGRHRRLWVVLNRDIRFRSPGEKIVWQDPGGRVDLFVRTNFELMHQTYLTDVFLWDGSKGRLRTFRRTL